MKIILLVGTMTGTAQLVAQELELVWDDGELQVETLLMDKLMPPCSSARRVPCSSPPPTGRGTPDNAKASWKT
jgi:flavodoxin